jgi:cytochrome oxidase Cu insertion factor (SCO1/SenC/PrrC family)
MSALIFGVELRLARAEFDRAPDFTLTDIDGEVFSLSDHRGSIVLIDFFFIACTPCEVTMPYLKQFHDAYSPKLVIISITVSPNTDTQTELNNYREDNEMAWIIARDTENNDLAILYGVSAAPTLFIIDADGYIRHMHVGSQDMDEVEDLLEGLDEADSTSPSLTVQRSPTTSDDTETVTFTVTAHDDLVGSGIETIELYVDGDLAKSWTSAGKHTHISGPYTEGTHEYYATVSDSAGNNQTFPSMGTESFDVVAPTPEPTSEDSPWTLILMMGGLVVVAVLVIMKVLQE